MNAEELAELYALQIKAGELTRTNAVMYFRSRHEMSYIDALIAIDIAIGNLNEGIYLNDEIVLGYSSQVA